MSTPTPNGHAERLTRLERTVAQHASDIARVQGDVASNTEMIRALAPLVSQLATVAEAQRHLQTAVSDLRTDWREDVRHFDAEIDRIGSGIEQEQRDNKNYRRALAGIGLAAILSPIGSLVVALTLNAP